ncbi:MAG: NrtA/SsuA/CpmA family ABC transporter substrate-binding protein [Patescibacteria group bacterium]|jgi:NitT/TauT family transport system substrate-binding protein
MKRWLISAVVIIVVVGFFIFRPKANNALKHVTVGFQSSPPMALLMIAKDKGFFEKQGLDVELKEFTAGKFALGAFLGGSLDFSVSADVPPLLAALQGNQFVVPAQLVKQTKSEVRVVAKKDGDLNDAAAYFKAKKRKLATLSGGGPEFFTYEFLNKLGIKKEQIEIINQKPEDMVAALMSGSVDAISMFDPVAYVAEQQMGDNAIIFTDEAIYSELYVIEAPISVKTDSAVLEKFLLALKDAEQFLQENPDAVKEVVAKYTKLDRKTVDGVWGNTNFGLSLTPQLLEYWKREVAWAKDVGKIANDVEVPNVENYIYSAPLRKIDPTAVSF